MEYEIKKVFIIVSIEFSLMVMIIPDWDANIKEKDYLVCTYFNMHK